MTCISFSFGFDLVLAQHADIMSDEEERRWCTVNSEHLLLTSFRSGNGFLGQKALRVQVTRGL